MTRDARREESIQARGPADDAPSRERPGATDPGLIAAVGERVQAEAARIGTLGEIVLAETRLAGTSALTLLAIALVGAALAVVIWLLLMTLVTLAFIALGLGPAASVALVLVLHLGLAAALGLVARQLLANLRFEHTLGALGRRARADEPPA